MPLIAPDYNTAFTCDALGRYVCNTFAEALVTIDPNARAAAGLPARNDLRPLVSSLLAEAHWARLLLNICGSEAPIAVSAF